MPTLCRRMAAFTMASTVKSRVAMNRAHRIRFRSTDAMGCVSTATLASRAGALVSAGTGENFKSSFVVN